MSKVRVYKPQSIDDKVGTRSTVRKFWVNKVLTSIKLDDDLVIAVEKMEEHFGAKLFLKSVNAVFALPQSKSHVSGSEHYKGKAIDMCLMLHNGTKVKTLDMARYAETVPEIKGIGLYKPGNEHIHIDTRRGRTCWWLVASKSNTPSFGGVPCVYRLGHRSPFIQDAQRLLKARGFYDGAIDGVFTPAFRLDLIEFQKVVFPSLSKDWDGILGLRTQAKLFNK